MTPHGMTLLDYFNGDKDARITTHLDDGMCYKLPVRYDSYAVSSDPCIAHCI
jgi:hypothetical protein